MKQYLVMAQDEYETEVVSTHDTLEGAQAVLDRCIEGDDKHNPCEYFIKEKETIDYTFNYLFVGESK